MEAARSSETLVSYHNTTEHNTTQHSVTTQKTSTSTNDLYLRKSNFSISSETAHTTHTSHLIKMWIL